MNKKYSFIFLALMNFVSITHTSNTYDPFSPQSKLMSALCNRPEEAETIIKSGINLNFLGGVLDETPLIEICFSPRTSFEQKRDLIYLCLLHGANINMQAEFGKTALTTAIQNGNTELVKFLLDMNADPNHSSIKLSNIPLTPLALAHYVKSQEIINLLEQYGAKPLTQEQRRNVSKAIEKKDNKWRKDNKWKYERIECRFPRE